MPPSLVDLIEDDGEEENEGEEDDEDLVEKDYDFDEMLEYLEEDDDE